MHAQKGGGGGGFCKRDGRLIRINEHVTFIQAWIWHRRTQEVTPAFHIQETNVEDDTATELSSIYCKHPSWRWPSGKSKSHSPAAGLCNCRWPLEAETGKTRGSGEAGRSGAPVTAMEQLPARRTHRTGPSGLCDYAQRTGGQAAGRGSGSAGGCSSTLPGSWAWQPTWL